MSDYHCDDIDIEEHDILDNPLIRNIFPDLSVVKKEISDYFNESLPAKQLTNPIKQEPGLPESKSPQYISSNKTSPSYKNNHESFENKNVQKETPSKTIEKNPKYTLNKETNISFQNNKIILGSKPNDVNVKSGPDTKGRNQIRFPKIFLHDVKSHLEKSERYCKECKILFIKKTKLKEHDIKQHSEPKKQDKTRSTLNVNNKMDDDFVPSTDIDTKKNKVCENKKSFRKTATNMDILEKDNKPFTRLNSSQTKTNENIRLSTDSNITSSEEDEEVQMPFVKRKSSSVGFEIFMVESLSQSDIPKCRICDIRVANIANLRRHYRGIHRKKLMFGGKKTTDKSNEMPNLSTKSIKVPEVKKVGNVKNAHNSSNYCRTCNVQFCSVYSLHRHNRNIHQSGNDYSSSKTKVNQHVKTAELVTKNLRSNTKDEENKKCQHCDKEFPDSKSLIEHIYEILGPKKSNNSNKCVSEIKQAECNIVDKKYFEEKNELGSDIIKHNKDYLDTSKVSSDEDLSSPSIQNYDNDTKSINKSLPTKHQLKDENIISSSKIKTDNDNLKGNKKESKTKNIYVCPQCSYCLSTAKDYYRHMANNHGTKVSKINKQSFDPQCRYCSSKNTSTLSHNRHLSKEHMDILKKKIKSEIKKNSGTDKSENKKIRNSESFSFKSAVFKCLRCDIHFVSSELAKDHTGHMEFLINWKCSICNNIFKKRDEKMHLLQHLSSEHIPVYEFDSDTLSGLLYNCTKCAIHFSEKKYLDHYEKCETETALSTYCKACDILINDKDAKTHSINHNKNRDFTSSVITSDIIFENKSEKTVSKNRNKIRKPYIKYGKVAVNSNVVNVTLTYCPTCQCYMTIVRNIHLEKQCTKLIKHICVDCGLLLTNKCIDTHRRYHSLKDLTLQDFIFTDLLGNIIKPPIPEYPQCKICKLYFVNKLEIISHVCNELKDTSSCDICKINLSDTAFKLHMPYHNYYLKNEKPKEDINIETRLEKNREDVRNDTEDDRNNTASSLSKPNDNSTPNSNQTQTSSIIKIDPNTAVLFTCKTCLISLITYDTLIEHCQNHHTADEVQSLHLKACNICNLKFDVSTYEIHKELHTNKLTIKNLSVDLNDFYSENKTWVNNIFQTMDHNQVNEIIGKSIYMNEHRVRFQMLQDGPHNLTIYKCGRCNLFFDHENVFKHSKCKNLNVRGTVCASCGLTFLTWALRNQHLKIHQTHSVVNEKSYRIVLFNQASQVEHPNVAAQSSPFVIYQCRNCNGVIDKSVYHQCDINDLKKCNECGLLIYKDSFKNHALNHKNLINFQSDNMKVILLGTKEKTKGNEISTLHPSFKGLIYDYTLYQCKHCEICVKNDTYIPLHICVFGIYRCQCHKCDYFFTSRGYNQHHKTHNVDPDFKKEYINIVQFDLKSNSVEEKSIKSNEKIKTEEPEQKLNIVPENAVVLYKCKCGLHYVDRSKIIKHFKQCSPKTRTYKQNCTKCNLLFNPSELFSHLVKHHGNKNQIKFDVKEISDKNIEEFKKVVLFNCSKCGLHYLDKDIANEHYKICNGELKDFEECTKCKIVYDKSSFVSDDHNDKCEIQFEIEIIDETNIEVTANDDLSFKCDNITTE